MKSLDESTSVGRQPDADPPRIYVASLADYNAGRLHGRWIDATQEIDQVWIEVNSMLAASREPGAEEWAIHDNDNFGPVRIGEYERLERIVDIGRGIAEHGIAYACWVSTLDGDESAEAIRFNDAYIGTYDSIEAYAEELLDGLGIETNPSAWAPEILAPFVSFHWRAFALSLGDDYAVVTYGGQAYIFEP